MNIASVVNPIINLWGLSLHKMAMEWRWIKRQWLYHMNNYGHVWIDPSSPKFSPALQGHHPPNLVECCLRLFGNGYSVISCKMEKGVEYLDTETSLSVFRSPGFLDIEKHQTTVDVIP